MDKKGQGTQTHQSFTMGSKVVGRKRVVVYWRKSLDGKVKIVREDKRSVLVKVWGKTLGGVYADEKIGGRAWQS